MTDLAKELADFLATHVPITRHLGLSVDGYDGDELICRLPLAPNVNDKGTAFGGSLYTLCVGAAWGMMYLRCRERGEDISNLVIANGAIAYLSPVRGDCEARCVAPATDVWQTFFDQAKERGRAKIELAAEVLSDGQVAARFSGQYALVSPRSVQAL